MGSKRSKFLMATSGVLTALVIVFSQLYCFQEFCKKSESLEKAKQEQHDADNKKTADNEAFFTMPSSIVPSSVSIGISQEIVFIYDVSFDNEEQNTPEPRVRLPLGKLFKTLFRVIIAPNAP